MQPNICTIRNIRDDMTGKGGDGDREDAPPRRQDRLPPEILDLIKPALQVGGVSGMSGLVVGGFMGIIRGRPAFVSALASGIQWFTMGTTFWTSRGVVLHTWRREEAMSRDKITVSAIAGGISGAAGGLVRGPRTIIPRAIFYTLFGAVGQALYNRANASQTAKAALGTEPKSSWLDSKWSPMKVLSDEDYGNMLRERLLRVNAEIALVDESMEAIRIEEREMEAKRVESTTNKEDLTKK